VRVGPIIAIPLIAAFCISFILTAVMKRLAVRMGFVDKPGGRKIHANPKPLGGGVAIFWGFTLPMLAVILVAKLGSFQPGFISPDYWGGIQKDFGLACNFLFWLFVLHCVGIADDVDALNPFIKLVLQIVAAADLVVPFKEIRVLTALGPVTSVVVTILWIVAITNAFNFLDNMDGLSAGIAAVASSAFLITTILIGQWFVAASLALLLGALLAFLCFNFAPASIFMGDSGSLVIGFILGVLTVRTTFLPHERQWANGWYAVFAPVIVLAVPLYDLIVVSVIRLSRGKSPFVGDTNHFSHRLVARGMTRRTAVLCLYLITAATSVAAILLPYVETTFAAMLIFGQTVLILCVVALLEQHPLPSEMRE